MVILHLILFKKIKFQLKIEKNTIIIVSIYFAFMEFLQASCYILCGGSGIRLYPIASDKNPKYDYDLNILSKSLSEPTTLENAIIRSKKIFKDVNLISKVDHELTINKYIVRHNNLFALFEERPKNTMMSVVSAAKHALWKYGDDAIIVVMPSDQIIDLKFIFANDINKAIMHTKNTKKITLFGFKKFNQDTKDFGCIFYDDIIGEFYSVSKFIEKPSENISGEKIFLNSGIFVIPAKKFIDDISYMYRNIDVEFDENFVKYSKDSPEISFDHGVLSKINPKEINVLESNFDFIDIGLCKSIRKKFCDKNGNVIVGNININNVRNSYLVNKNYHCVDISNVENIVINIEKDGKIFIFGNHN
jgi:mannose-1-phosphate guanylyltransferase